MTLLAVAPNKFARGIESATDDWRNPDNPRHVKAEYEPIEIADALERTWQSDAHFVTYIVRDSLGFRLEKQPRVNKSGLPWLLSQGYSVEVEAFVCDVDNPDHGPWTDALMRAAVELHATAPILATTGVYATAHGRRIVQPIAKPIPAQNAEPYLARWLRQLEQAGVAVDWGCRDWTRHFRCPHVRRDRRPYRSPWMAL